MGVQETPKAIAVALGALQKNKAHSTHSTLHTQDLEKSI